MQEQVEASEKPTRSLHTVKRLLRLFGPYKWRTLTGFSLMFVSSGLALYHYKIVGMSVDRVRQLAEAIKTGVELDRRQAVGCLWPIPAFMLALYVIRILSHCRGAIMVRDSTMALLGELRRKFFDYTQKLAFRFHDETHSGMVVSRFTTDMLRINRFYSALLYWVLDAVLIGTVAATLMFLASWKLALVGLATSPLTCIYLLKKTRQLRPMQESVHSSFENLSSMLKENIAGAQVIRAFGTEDYERRRFDQGSDDYISTVDRTLRFQARAMPVATMIYNMTFVFIWLYGGYLVMNNTLRLGELIAFNYYLSMVSQRVQMVTSIIVQGQMCLISAEKVFEIFDARLDVSTPPQAQQLPAGEGRVEFKDVWFAYEDEKFVLKDINFTVEPGQVVAIVGPTGAGKSTLVQLLPRFYDVTRGVITIDGVDIQRMTLDSLRREIGMVFQDTFLFSTTVKENISYARPDASMEEIIRCAKVAEAHQFIMELEDGYDSIIGERGTTLSGGQRQRIAIARALLKNPRILLLDDSTAAIDPATEKLIRNAIRELIRGRTTFVIAHRLTTVMAADMILVLDHGRIVQRGTHEQLLATDGLYKRIHDEQFRMGSQA